jgi:hypothetical protein
MNKKLIYIGLDVDDTQYHGAGFDKETGEIVSFQCRPTLKGLVCLSFPGKAVASREIRASMLAQQVAAETIDIPTVIHQDLLVMARSAGQILHAGYIH